MKSDSACRPTKPAGFLLVFPFEQRRMRDLPYCQGLWRGAAMDWWFVNRFFLFGFYFGLFF
jgi:hypothetical protein